MVIDCTGVFKTEAKLAPYFDAGVKKVVVSAPVKDGDAANIVYGVNHDIYEPDRHRIVISASCTTNCLAPVVKVIHENLRIKHGSITTIHNVTNTQTIVGRSGERPAPRAVGAEFPDPDNDGQCDRDYADLSRTDGPPERSRGPCAAA